MRNISYNLSPRLKESLSQVELYRRQIVLVPIAPKPEMLFRWQASVDRIYLSLFLAGRQPGKSQIIKLLSMMGRRKVKPEEKEVVGLKRAFDKIVYDWILSDKTVSVKVLSELNQEILGTNSRLPEAQLAQVLDYIQVNPENPVIQAAIAQIEIFRLTLSSSPGGLLPRLASYLFLYKAGLDFRGFMVLEEVWRHDFISYKHALEASLKNDNLTQWIEYFISSMLKHLESLIAEIKKTSPSQNEPNQLVDLNDRQKEILAILEEPRSTISNRKVQKLFNVSQITSSRDLARLASLGLIFAKGRGRSTQYTRF